eukprot:g12893.t1
MGLTGAEGGSLVAGAEPNAATGTGETEDHHRPELRRHGRALAVGSEAKEEEEDEEEQPRQPMGGGHPERERKSLNRLPELEFGERTSTTDSGEEGCIGGEVRGGGRKPKPREHGGVLQGFRDGHGERLAKPPGMPVPRLYTMDAIAQNSLLGALLSYQDGVAGATYADGDRASRLGHLGLIKMQQESTPLFERGRNVPRQPLSFTPAAMDGAAGGGHLEVVRWLHHHREEGGTSEALIQASANGHKDVVKWLLANRSENDIWRALGAVAESSFSRESAASAPPPLCVAGAARGGNENQLLNPVLETLFKALPPGLAELSTREWVSKAATAGRVDFLEWLQMRQGEAGREGTGSISHAEQGLQQQEQEDGGRFLEYSSSALAGAARGGHIEVLNWFLENGVCSADPRLQRARRRHFHNRGAGTTMCDAATTSGNNGGGNGVGGCCGSNDGNLDGDSRSGISGNPIALGFAPVHGSFPPRAVPTSGGEGADASRDQQEEKEEAPAPAAPTPNSCNPPTTSTVDSTNRRRRDGEYENRRWLQSLRAAGTAASTRLAKLSLLQRILPLSGSSGNSNGDGGCVAEGAGAKAGPSESRQGSGVGRRWGSKRAPPPPEKMLATTPAVEDAAANAGDLEVLEWLNAHAKPAVPPRPSSQQKRSPFGRSHTKFYGKKTLANWRAGGAGAGPGRRCSRLAFERACEGGHFSTAVWLASRRSEAVEKAHGCIRKAAKNGHLQIVAWLSSSREWNPSTNFRDRWAAATTAAMDDAAAGGHLKVVQWLHEHRMEGCTSAAMDKAAAAGHLQMVKWLHRNRQEGCSTKAMDLAAAAGHLDVVKWLHEHRDEGCSSAAMDGAAEHNRLQTLEWLRQNRDEGWTLRYGAQAAARNGNLTALSYLLLGGKDDAMQGYDDGFGGLAALSAAGSTSDGPGFDVIGGGVNDFRGWGRGGLGGASGCAGGCCCEGNDDDYAFEALDVDRYDGSQNSRGSGAGGSRTGQDEVGSGGDGLGGDDTNENEDTDTNADADAGGGADAVDGLRLAGGGVVATPVTLDLDEAAAEGRLGVLQWARCATMEVSPCATSPADGKNGSRGRSRKGGRGRGSVCRGFGCGRYGPSPALCSSGGDGEEQGEVKEGGHEEEKKEEGDATEADKVVPLRCWSGDPNGDNSGDQEKKEGQGGAREGLAGNTSRLNKGADPPGDRCHCPCRCHWGSQNGRHSSYSALLPSTVAAPTAVAPTRAPTTPISSCRVSASSTPLVDAAGGGGDGGSSDGAAKFGDVGTATGVGVASAASADASADSPVTPSDVPSTVASALPVVDGGKAITATAATAVCLGSSNSSGGCCCRWEYRVANAYRSRTDGNGWIHRRVRQLSDDARPVGYGRRRQGVTERKTSGKLGAAAGRIERLAYRPSLGAYSNRIRVTFSTAAVDGAAGNGHLEVVRWLLFHRREGGTAAAFEAAATNGHVHVLEWLMTHTALRPEVRGGSPLVPSVLARASANGHLGVVRWFHRNMSKIPTDAEDASKAVGFTYHLMDEAAGNGHLQICKWLHQHRREGCSWNAFDGAAAGAHMHVLCWLDEFYPSVGPSAVAFVKAARAGSLHVLQWLLRRYPGEAESGCMWAFQELSETTPYEPITGIRRNWTVDDEVLELVKLVWTSRRKRGWFIDLALGGGLRIEAP